MPAKNRKITSFYSGLAAGAVVMLGLTTIIPKESRTIALVQGKQLDVPSFVTPRSPKTQHSLIYIAIFAGLIMSGCSVAMVLVCSKRQEELPKERQAYEIDLEAQRRIIGANAAGRVAVATSAAKMAAEAEIDIYTNDLLARFEAVAEKSNWVALPEPVKPTKASALAEVEAQWQSLEAKSREFDRSCLPQANLSDSVDDTQKKTFLTDDSNTFGVSEISDSNSATTPGLLHPSETKAFSILSQLAGSRMSLLLIAGTGGGKTVTQACLISLLLEKCPKAEFWVVSQKNDNYCGLKAKNRVTIFDINNVKNTLDVIHHVWEIYNTRRMLSEDKRKNLSPVRLLLADWLSINSALTKLKSHPDVKESNYLVELADIVFNGRDFNVCLWADLQSFLLKAIGMEADSNSRQNFNLLGLGNYYTDEFGFVNESYGVLVNMINNHYMVANEEARVRLVGEFDRLKPISTHNQRPILFSTLEPASVCLQADVRHYQQQYQATIIEPETTKKIDLIGSQIKVEAERESEIEWLERIFKLKPEVDEAETFPESFHVLKRPEGENSSDFKTVYFTSMKLEKNQAIELIQKLKHEMKHNQTEIIWMLWNARPGKTKTYESALAEYKELTTQEENNEQ